MYTKRIMRLRQDGRTITVVKTKHPAGKLPVVNTYYAVTQSTIDRLHALMNKYKHAMGDWGIAIYNARNGTSQ